MITGLGIDIVEIERMQQLVDNERFIARVLTENERQLLKEVGGRKRQVEFLAGRYACKEAFSKAYGTGLGPVSFHDLEILRNEKGAPIFTKSPFDGAVFVSISHTDTIAMAEVILSETSTH